MTQKTIQNVTMRLEPGTLMLPALFFTIILPVPCITKMTNSKSSIYSKNSMKKFPITLIGVFQHFSLFTAETLLPQQSTSAEKLTII